MAPTPHCPFEMPSSGTVHSRLLGWDGSYKCKREAPPELLVLDFECAKPQNIGCLGALGVCMCHERDETIAYELAGRYVR